MIQAATFGRKADPQAQESEERFSGINMRLAPDKVPAGFGSAAENYRFREGEWTPRKGVVKPAWLNVTNPGVDNTIAPVDAFYGAGVFQDPDGVEWSVAAADGAIFRSRPHNCRFALPLPTSVKILSACTFTQAFNKLYCFRGRHLAPLVLATLDAGFVDVVAHWSASATYKGAVVATGQVADEVSYGPFQAVASLTSVADVATVVTTAEHGYVTGADVTIQGANQTEYNGRWNITVIDAVTFQYQFGGSATTPATGTIKVANSSFYWKAIGSQITLGAGELTSAAGVATVHHTAHGFLAGQYVTVTGATQPEYNGTFLIATVADADHFTYAITGAPASPATTTTSIKAQSSPVQAGQSPDTNPEAWSQIFNVLPNADDALFINNRLLVPTAYTPGATGYDASSSYTKKDFIVATDIQDDVHFDFQNEFRINQGSDDEIVCLVKYGPDTALVFKSKSWGVLTNIGIDLANLTLDMRRDGYGACARAAVVAGRDVLFPVLRRGIVSVTQNQLGQLRSVDVPLSNDIQGQPGALINRINWNYGSKIRLAYWDDKLYAAVPLDDAALLKNVNIISPDALWGTSGAVGYTLAVTPGRRYHFDAGTQVLNGVSHPVGKLLLDGTTFLTSSQDFTPSTDTVSLYHILLVGPGPPPGTLSAVEGVTVKQYLQGVNNAVLVYDFRAGDNGAWQGMDTGVPFCPQEFFKANYCGAERLFFIAEDGYVNLAEEAIGGDEIYDGTSANLINRTPILTRALPRGYRLDSESEKRFKQMQIILGVWDAEFTVKTNTGAVSSARTEIEAESFSRFTYIRPFDRAPYVEGNVNDDFATAGRGNYAVDIEAGGLNLGSAGVDPHLIQEVRRRVSIPRVSGRYLQIEITNATGLCVVKSIAPVAAEGQRRAGSII